MRKVFILSILLLTLGLGVSAQKGQSSIGGTLAYNTEKEITGIGVSYQYNLHERLRIAPQFTYFFERNDVSAFSIDLNWHYAFPLDHLLTLYPIGGLNFTDVDLGSSSDSGFGINAGIGLQFPITKLLDFSTEYKRSILFGLRDDSTIGFSVVYKF